jgi:hypothetical protein
MRKLSFHLSNKWNRPKSLHFDNSVSPKYISNGTDDRPSSSHPSISEPQTPSSHKNSIFTSPRILDRERVYSDVDEWHESSKSKGSVPLVKNELLQKQFLEECAPHEREVIQRSLCDFLKTQNSQGLYHAYSLFQRIWPSVDSGWPPLDAVIAKYELTELVMVSKSLAKLNRWTVSMEMLSRFGIDEHDGHVIYTPRTPSPDLRDIPQWKEPPREIAPRLSHPQVSSTEKILREDARIRQRLYSLLSLWENGKSNHMDLLQALREKDVSPHAVEQVLFHLIAHESSFPKKKDVWEVVRTCVEMNLSASKHNRFLVSQCVALGKLSLLQALSQHFGDKLDYFPISNGLGDYGYSPLMTCLLKQKNAYQTSITWNGEKGYEVFPVRQSQWNVYFSKKENKSIMALLLKHISSLKQKDHTIQMEHVKMALKAGEFDMVLQMFKEGVFPRLGSEFFGDLMRLCQHEMPKLSWRKRGEAMSLLRFLTEKEKSAIS